MIANGDINGMLSIFKDRTIEGTNQFVLNIKNVLAVKKSG